MQTDPIALIGVEVVYATPKRQILLALQMAVGSTVCDAIARSEILCRCPELTGKELQVGVFGRHVTPMYQLQDGDRVEIYRPLQIDPKQARRRRVGR